MCVDVVLELEVLEHDVWRAGCACVRARRPAARRRGPAIRPSASPQICTPDPADVVLVYQGVMRRGFTEMPVVGASYRFGHSADDTAATPRERRPGRGSPTVLISGRMKGYSRGWRRHAACPITHTSGQAVVRSRTSPSSSTSSSTPAAGVKDIDRHRRDRQRDPRRPGDGRSSGRHHVHRADQAGEASPTACSSPG